MTTPKAKTKAEKTVDKTVEIEGAQATTMGKPEIKPQAIYRVAQGKTVLDIAETMKKYIVTQLGGLSEVRTYWYQTFMGYPDPSYVSKVKKPTNTPVPRKLKTTKDVALGNQPSANPAGNFGRGNGVTEGFIPPDMK